MSGCGGWRFTNVRNCKPAFVKASKALRSMGYLYTVDETVGAGSALHLSSSRNYDDGLRELAIIAAGHSLWVADGGIKPKVISNIGSVNSHAEARRFALVLAKAIVVGNLELRLP